MARGKESWQAASHKRPPQNRGKNNKPLPKQDEVQVTVSTIPLALQQKCLNIFRDALPSGDDDAVLLQEVKGHLYKRDFATAFGKDEYLKIYASRWSASRALGYIQILRDLQEKLLAGHDEDEVLKVICLGGGAGAEVVALGAWLHEQNGSESDAQLSIQALMLDIAAWDTIVNGLQHAVVNPPVLSKYASAAAKAANVRMLSEDVFKTQFQQVDALDLSDEKSQALYGGADLITLMFTLNELYSTSVPKTQKMLARITDAAQPGTHLLVVDSPGSYSTVTINGAEKKYPIQWLLDHTLLGTQQKRGEEEKPVKWEKLVSDDSRWFRLPEGLEYRMELENMRYQIHLYRRQGEVEVEE
ncbi:Putative SAM-dependent methyltransferase [Septoria linicola]|uniref:SAM-dependent methyltransferase n=1 Tax=Septoria linicola TaxID=215465 RepID=A0A9Q9ACY7_9PEZI|nr:putative SAM-dependent methyltransferase [Septoria linicola]USW46835.1 Putative SAM-dependent methyltransferase [Septoria linicola]